MVQDMRVFREAYAKKVLRNQTVTLNIDRYIKHWSSHDRKPSCQFQNRGAHLFSSMALVWPKEDSCGRNETMRLKKKKIQSKQIRMNTIKGENIPVTESFHN